MVSFLRSLVVCSQFAKPLEHAVLGDEHGVAGQFEAFRGLVRWDSLEGQ